MGCLIVDKREGRNTAELIQALFAVVAVTPVSASPGTNSSGAFTRVVTSCSPHPVGLNPIRVFASVVQSGTGCFEGLSLVAHRSYLKPS